MPVDEPVPVDGLALDSGGGELDPQPVATARAIASHGARARSGVNDCMRPLEARRPPERTLARLTATFMIFFLPNGNIDSIALNPIDDSPSTMGPPVSSAFVSRRSTIRQHGKILECVRRADASQSCGESRVRADPLQTR